MSAISISSDRDEQQGLLAILDDSGREAGLRRGFRGWGQRLSVSCRRLINRTSFSLASSLGLVISPIGGVCVLGTGALISTAIMGITKSFQVTLTSVGIIATLQFLYSFATSPSRELSGTEVLAQLSGGDDSMWKAGKDLMKTFDKLLKAFPDLNRPRIAALRDGAPDELLLRFMTIIGRHQKAVNPDDVPDTTAPGEEVSPPADTQESGNTPQGTAASEDVIKDLQYWILFAEAAYYEMATEDRIGKWLARMDCDLLYASSQNSQNSPVYFVAVHEQRKELIVTLRGTMSVSDAVTDLIVTPERWGDGDHTVHSGIGKSAETVYRRLKHLAPSFAGAGYSVVIVGHSLGAGVAALLAWRLREQDGVAGVRAVAFATPPCTSPNIARESREFVLSCVFRDDVVPRLAPKAIVSLEKELMSLEWAEMEACAGTWGPVGGVVLKRAKDAAKTNSEELDQLEQQHREDPLGHGKNGGEGRSGTASDGASEVLMEPTVPGKIVMLHAMTEWARCCKAANMRAEEGQGEAVPADQREVDFRCVEVDSEDPCLCAFRLCNQSVDDHFLEQYRMGLRMRPRIPGQGEDPPGVPRR